MNSFSNVDYKNCIIKMSEKMKEKLINCIFQYPEVWDKKNKHHHNRYYLSKIWKNIAKEVGITEKVAKNVWKNLRQEFGRQLRKTTRSGDPILHQEEIINSWHYFHSLLFLKDQFNPRSANSKLYVPDAAENEDEEDGDDDEMADGDSDSEQPHHPHHHTLSGEIPVTITPDINEMMTRRSGGGGGGGGYRQRNSSQQTTQVEQQSLLNLEREHYGMQKSTFQLDPNDEDIGFFNSLLPHLKKLNSENKMIFRMKVQQLLFDLSFPHREQKIINVAWQNSIQYSQQSHNNSHSAACNGTASSTQFSNAVVSPSFCSQQASNSCANDTNIS